MIARTQPHRFALNRDIVLVARLVNFPLVAGMIVALTDALARARRQAERAAGAADQAKADAGRLTEHPIRKRGPHRVGRGAPGPRPKSLMDEYAMQLDALLFSSRAGGAWSSMWIHIVDQGPGFPENDQQ